MNFHLFAIYKHTEQSGEKSLGDGVIAVNFLLYFGFDPAVNVPSFVSLVPGRVLYGK